MKTLTIILATILVSACASIDSGITKDATITAEDMLAFKSACSKSGGVLEAKKAYVLMTQKYEFRITCKNGSTFVVDPAVEKKPAN